MLINHLIMLVFYVIHIFVCRHLDFGIIKMETKYGLCDDGTPRHETVPMLWFIPFAGLFFVGVFAFATWTQVWRKTPSGKWFLGNDIKE
jgi:hypothetical protein